MPGINNRVFGSDIDVRIKKKLEARQLLAEKDRSPLEPITSQYNESPTDVPNTFGNLNELNDLNFDGVADLSSRTPFVRMWTAIEIRSHAETGVPVNEAPPKDDGFIYVKKDGKIIQKKVINHERIVYEIGNHINNEFSDALNQRQGNALGGVTSKDVIPNVFETNNNEFMKPAAGITSVTSNTEGMLGAIKKTTVNFVVHNFHDYDKIYSRYFLRPGAQVFVDFGWDSIKELYKPQDLVDDGKISISPKGNSIEEILFGKSGYVTESYGDLETLVGFVTNFDSKVKENGSVECSLEIVSKNAALIQGDVDEKLKNRILYFLDVEIMNYASKYFKEFQGDKNLLNPNWSNSATDINKANQISLLFASKNLSGNGNAPTGAALKTGVYWQSGIKGDKVIPGSTKNIFISFGLFEDKILNSEFGVGLGIDSIVDENKENKDAGTFQVRFDSSESFMSWDLNLSKRQFHETNATDLKYIYPNTWAKTYNSDRKKTPTRTENEKQFAKIKAPPAPPPALTPTGKLTVSDIGNTFGAPGKDPLEFENQDEVNRYYEIKNNLSNSAFTYTEKQAVDAAYGKILLERQQRAEKDELKPVTEVHDPPEPADEFDFTIIDKMAKRIPLREVFISLKLIKDAFQENIGKTIEDVIKYILDEINADSYEVLDLKISSLKQDDTTLSIIDRNLVKGQSENKKDFFDNLFVFKPMSKGSIVKSYDLSISTPKGELQSMLAIQTLPSGRSLFPLEQITDKYLALNASNQGEVRRDESGNDTGIVYLPEIGTYQTDNVDEDSALDSNLALNFQNDKFLNDSNFDVNQLLDGQAVSYDDLGEIKDEDIEEDSQITTTQLAEISGNIKSAANIAQFFGFLALNETINIKPTIIPATLSLTIYGISSLVPGDIFRVDYLPERQRKLLYFQVTKVTHNINSSTWSTTLETVPRIRPEKKNQSGLYRRIKDVVLSYNSVESVCDKSISKFKRFMVMIKYVDKGFLNQFDYVFEFISAKGANQSQRKDFVHTMTVPYKLLGEDMEVTEIRKKEGEYNISPVGNINYPDFQFEVKGVRNGGGEIENYIEYTYEFKVKIKDNGVKFKILIKNSSFVIIPSSLYNLENHKKIIDYFTTKSYEPKKVVDYGSLNRASQRGMLGP